MPIKNYSPETFVVRLGKDNSFTVRGITFTDLSRLIRTHQADLEVTFALYDKAIEQSKIGRDDVGDMLILNLLNDAPLLVAELIRIASGEEDLTDETILSLPFPTQIIALTQIVRLTFEEVGGVKNFLGMLLPMFGQMGVRIPRDLQQALLKKLG